MTKTIYFLEKEEQNFILKTQSEEIITVIQADNVDTCLEILLEETDVDVEIGCRTNKQCTFKTIYGDEEIAIIKFLFDNIGYEKHENASQAINIFDKEKMLGNIINKYQSLEELCESLNNCFDLYDLGYIDSEQEQIIYNKLSEESALRLWAIYMHIKEGSSLTSYYLTYEDFLSTI
ncbi:hypothetical protein HMI01_29550 [Halolactibacillus miurensis]|uniref:Uncharacterized protein n=2 Tax=Halolactibacillus TaxID=306539 RepID=A0A1I6U269_9BACI|nr:hypothetical protein [Halolactibacillus miurensis]GEM05967.1 hypothetical protein HMI01_29550 [Halolactibacillus miurensis]SFS95540.1 hypothetical protein SAMN05421668_1215 [Halolactibacillus miurensis]